MKKEVSTSLALLSNKGMKDFVTPQVAVIPKYWDYYFDEYTFGFNRRSSRAQRD